MPPARGLGWSLLYLVANQWMEAALGANQALRFTIRGIQSEQGETGRVEQAPSAFEVVVAAVVAGELLAVTCAGRRAERTDARVHLLADRLLNQPFP